MMIMTMIDNSLMAESRPKSVSWLDLTIGRHLALFYSSDEPDEPHDNSVMMEAP